jgi:hypothetical protein
MAAVNAAVSVDKKLMRATYVHSAGQEAPFPDPRGPYSDVRRTNPQYTDPKPTSTNAEVAQIQQTLVNEEMPDLGGLAAAPSPASAISGSVAGVLTDYVDIACNAGGEAVHLHLPKSLVPEELHIYGTPVRLMLSDKGGRRTPIVEARSPDKIELTEEERDALAWLEEDAS